MKQKPYYLSIIEFLHNRNFFAVSWFIAFNTLTLAILIGLTVYAKIYSKGGKIATLFSDPFQINVFYLGWLTSISEILWVTAIAICLFTYTLLPITNRIYKSFFLSSALLMSLFYFDDRFRLTLILCAFFGSYIKVKISIYLIYGILMIAYGKVCWKTIKATNYFPLLLAFFLFGFSSAADIAPISNRGVHAILEDGTKLVGLINVTAYFWYICHQQIKRIYS